MSKHAVISPSGFKAIMLCPAKVAMERGLPDRASEDAQEGTAAHSLGEICLRHGAPAARFLGEVIDVEGKEFVVNQEMVEAVQVYLDVVADFTGGDGDLFVEQRVPIGHITGEDGAEGTSDAVIVRGDELIVIDLKYGRGVEVDATDNPQLKLYGLGALEKFGMVADFSKVTLVISQPRISKAPSVWSISVDDLQRWAQAEATPAAKTALYLYQSQPGNLTPWQQPAEDACRFCRAKADCKGLAEFVKAQLQAEFTDLTTESPVQQEATVAAKVDTAQATDTVGQMLAAVPVIEMWCKAIRARAERMLFAGQPVEGFKLVEGRRPARTWIDPTAAEAALKAMRMKKEQMYDQVVISPTTAEKLFKDNPRRWAKLSALIKRGEAKPSVAPVSDKRPALEQSMSSEFTPIPTELAKEVSA